MELKPIQTIFKGYRFRSRLEARFATFLDYLGVKWDYEPEGFETKAGRYLPDFWLKDFGCWLEIKPCLPNDEEIAKAEALAEDGQPVLISCNSFDQNNPKGILYAYDSSEDSAGFGEYPAFIYPAMNGEVYIATDYHRVQHYHNAEYDDCLLIVSQPTLKSYGGKDHRRFMNAWNAGRSARFEHNERGAW